MVFNQKLTVDEHADKVMDLKIFLRMLINIKSFILAVDPSYTFNNSLSFYPNNSHFLGSNFISLTVRRSDFKYG